MSRITLGGLLIAGLFAAAVLVPLVAGDAFLRHLLVLWGIFTLLALSMNFVFGYIGELSFGHAAFFGLGAYGSALISLKLGVSPWLGLVFAAALAGLAGLVIGYATLRIKGPQFAIVTLAFASILYVIDLNWIDLTRGPMGLTQIPPYSVGGIAFTTELFYYYLLLALVSCTVYLAWRLMNSPAGRAMIGLRENDALAEAVGINVLRYKLLAFVLATIVAGIAGSVFVHYLRFVDPVVFTPLYVIAMIISVVVGGRGTLAGPILGALVFTFVPEYLRVAGDLRLLVFAAVLILFIMFMPQGLIRLPQQLVPRSRLARALAGSGRRGEPVKSTEALDSP
jgi:branched-chain amino acid transport system permease protein